MTPKLLIESAKSSSQVEYNSHIQTTEVARLVKEGKKRSEIARILKAKPEAIDYHLNKIRHGWPKSAYQPSVVDYNKYINWRVYNEGLVKRGEILMDFDIFSHWNKEIEEMNRGKVGAPFEYPDSFINFLLRFKTGFHIGYRQAKGLARRLIVFIPQAKRAPDYSTLQRRFETLEVELEAYQSGAEQDIAQDSSGIKTSNRGEYKTLKYEREQKKEYVKIHVAVNIQTGEVVGLEVTLSTVPDSQVSGELIRQAQQRGRIRRDFADSAYDSNKNYQKHLEEGIEAVIKPTMKGTLKSARQRLARLQRKKDRGRLKPGELGQMARLKVVIEYFQDSQLWKQKTEYGLRWHSEGHFSAFKRIMGDYVFSRKYETIVKELKFKSNLMNLFKFVSKGYRKEEVAEDERMPA
jgi:hypothetical protein